MVVVSAVRRSPRQRAPRSPFSRTSRRCDARPGSPPSIRAQVLVAFGRCRGCNRSQCSSRTPSVAWLRELAIRTQMPETQRQTRCWRIVRTQAQFALCSPSARTTNSAASAADACSSSQADSVPDPAPMIRNAGRGSASRAPVSRAARSAAASARRVAYACSMATHKALDVYVCPRARRLRHRESRVAARVGSATPTKILERAPCLGPILRSAISVHRASTTLIAAVGATEKWSVGDRRAGPTDIARVLEGFRALPSMDRDLRCRARIVQQAAC